MEKKLTEDERFDLMVQGILERLPDREVPTVENPGLIGFIFDIPKTKNSCAMVFRIDELDSTKYVFEIGVIREGYDVKVRVDWKSGTEEELKEYMRTASKDPELWGEIRRQIEDLSNSVNEKIDD